MTTDTPYGADLKEVINLFVPESELAFFHTFSAENGFYENEIAVEDKTYRYRDKIPVAANALEKKRFEKRNVKLSAYKALSSFFGREMPWGALTGIRPTKLAYQELERSKTFAPLFDEMHVSRAKREIVEKILAAQRGIYKKDDENSDFFVFVPFCPSKCAYCSFITADITRSGKYVGAFLDALEREISAAWKLVKNLRSVYIGGGTPVALSAEQFERVLKAVGKHEGTEYTVEAGRPDCIDEEKLAIMEKYKVTRVCVNPQTFNDETLVRLGRKHTAKDIYEKYAIIKDRFSVNMDLIAGLEGETAEDFRRSLDAAIDYAHSALAKAGYSPYYLYRQKYMAGNLENTGYTLPQKACVYNVDTMEEISATVACGANAVSKAVFCGCERIERYKNPKDIPTYIAKIDEVIAEKEKLFAGKRR